MTGAPDRAERRAHPLRARSIASLHRHDFAQIWYILEGEFVISGETYGPGMMTFHPDPHYEEEMHTATGGLWLLVQYPGPSTGQPPIYDGRFNLAERKPIEAERLDV